MGSSLRDCGWDEGATFWFPFSPPLAMCLVESVQKVQWTPHHPPLTTTIIWLINTVCVLLQGEGEEEREQSGRQPLLLQECGGSVKNTFQIPHSLGDNFSVGVLRSQN